MTNQAIYLVFGFLALLFIASRIQVTAKKGGAHIIDDSVSTFLGFTPLEPVDRTAEELLLEKELGGQVFSRGSIKDFPANILYYYDSGRRRKGRSGMSSSRVTLVLKLTAPATFSMSIEPKLPMLLRGATPKLPLVPTGDPAFDERFEVYSDEASKVQSYLNPQLRNLMIALRREISPELPDDGGGWKAAASGVMMGKLRLKGHLLSFSINQSLSEGTANKLNAAIPVLSQFAADAGLRAA